jgi:pimeloyl-ACP methyl ester carboxylesterase
LAIRLVPAGRAGLTALVFVPVFLSVVATHRCKLTDGQDPMSVFNLPYEHVRIPTRDGLMLDGWFIPENPPSDRTIVICHGAGANKGNFVWFLGPLAHRGYNVLFFDFRAHGSSDGRTTTYGIRERADVIAVVDWLKANKPSESRVLVGLGSSQGSMALALAAAEDARIDAVVLDSPFVSPRALMRENARFAPVLGPLFADGMLALVSLQTGTSLFAPSAERAVAAIGPRPVLVIHGDDDFIMPRSHAQRLCDAACGPRDIWFGPGPHSNIITQAPSEYARRMFGFLEAHLPLK